MIGGLHRAHAPLSGEDMLCMVFCIGRASKIILSAHESVRSRAAKHGGFPASKGHAQIAGQSLATTHGKIHYAF